MAFNKFSGLHEPDKKEAVKGDPNIEAFNEVIRAIDKIRGAENEEDLIFNMVNTAKRYNDLKIELSYDVDYGEAVGQLQDVYTEANAEDMIETLKRFPELYAYGEPFEFDESVLDMEHRFHAEESVEAMLNKLYKVFDLDHNPDTQDALGACVKNLELSKKSEENLEYKKAKGYFKERLNCGEIWKIEGTRGVGREGEGFRPVLIITNNKGCAKSPKITCIAMYGYPAEDVSYQVEVNPATDVTDNRLTMISRIETTEIITVDRVRFKKYMGKLKPEKYKDVLDTMGKLYEII